MGQLIPFARRKRRRRRSARRWRTPAVFFVCLAALWVAFELGNATMQAATAAEIIGRASVVDGDTIEIRGERIRLDGIDAPESAQWCRDWSSRGYRCGQRAAEALSRRIGAGNVRCELLDRDRYGRHIGRCYSGDTDLNGWMVSEGHAVSYRTYSLRYLPAETIARINGTGIWGGEFDMPWDWRRGDRRILEGGRTSR